MRARCMPSPRAGRRLRPGAHQTPSSPIVPDCAPRARAAGTADLPHLLRGIPPPLPALPARGRAARGWRGGCRARCNAVDAVVVPSTAMHERLAIYGVPCSPMEILPHRHPAAGLRRRRRSALPPPLRHPGRCADGALHRPRRARKNIGFPARVAARLRRAGPTSSSWSPARARRAPACSARRSPPGWTAPCASSVISSAVKPPARLLRRRRRVRVRIAHRDAGPGAARGDGRRRCRWWRCPRWAPPTSCAPSAARIAPDHPDGFAAVNGVLADPPPSAASPPRRDYAAEGPTA